MLILEGAQAGLSWETILKRRYAYGQAFKQFDPHAVAQMSDAELEGLLTDSLSVQRICSGGNMGTIDGYKDFT